MAYDEILANRLRTFFCDFENCYEKEMMGGLCIMLNDKMCVGIIKEELMVRLDPEIYTEMLEIKGCKEMKFTGRPLKGYVLIEKQFLINADQLNFWVSKALAFNPKAKASKKKK